MMILKILAMTLSLLICFAFTACGNKKRESSGIESSEENTLDINYNLPFVEAVFTPIQYGNTDVEPTNMASIKEIIELRLIRKGITDGDIRIDADNQKLIVRFPCLGEEFEHESFVKELVSTSEIVFTNGSEEPASDGANIVMQGSEDVKSAVDGFDESAGNYTVELTFTESGSAKFAEITEQLAGTGETIGIWLKNGDGDYTLISAPMVQSAITDGIAIISGDFNAETAKEMAAIINTGSVSFSLLSLQIKYPTN